MGHSHYEILGVNEEASMDEIKKAYRKLSLVHHPDRNNNSKESNSIFKDINVAYEILGNNEKRKEYDFTRKNPFLNASGNVNSDDIMKMFFGGGAASAGMGENMFNMGNMGGGSFNVFHNGVPMNMNRFRQKPPPIIKTVNITLDQSYTGYNYPIEIERIIYEGGIRHLETEVLYLPIPKGVDDNEMMILKDKGNISQHGLKGDIKIMIKLINSTDFKRTGLDLIYKKKISLKDALCGFKFSMKYINGKTFQINNTAGNIIRPHFKKVIPKLGMIRDNHNGDLIIDFDIEFPEKLSAAEMKKLKEIL